MAPDSKSSRELGLFGFLWYYTKVQVLATAVAVVAVFGPLVIGPFALGLGVVIVVAIAAVWLWRR